jgi:multiple sugar transport system ATP-binding protein
MATIELRNVEKRFGTVYAVQPMDLTINDGEFVVLLGPSGCGKTTTLRMISGLEAVSGGNIYLNERDVTWRHPSDRDIAFVFQLFALYPHMTVQQNIAFPLQAQGESSDTIHQRVSEVVKMLQIEHLMKQRPGRLSGGDRQRVALARALVRRPAAFLMDEPLGALDADFRETMRAEIKQLHIDQHATTVYVTHDQIEAMAMSDRIVVMSNAVIQQVGTPAEVYNDPANLFVAKFIGSPGMNLFTGQFSDRTIRLPEQSFPVPDQWLRAFDGEKNVIVGFRPEAGEVRDDGVLAGEVYASDIHGSFNLLHIRIPDAENETQIIHIRTPRSVKHDIGDHVRFSIRPELIRFFDPATELALSRTPSMAQEVA